MEKELIPCICMTCGVRNDHSNEDGFCQNGHDDWLEFRDFKHETDFAIEAAERAEISFDELKQLFLDPEVKFILFVKYGRGRRFPMRSTIADASYSLRRLYKIGFKDMEIYTNPVVRIKFPNGVEEFQFTADFMKKVTKACHNLSVSIKSYMIFYLHAIKHPQLLKHGNHSTVS